jgi:glycosyl transferase family 1
VAAGDVASLSRRLFAVLGDGSVRFDGTPVGHSLDLVRLRLGARTSTRRIEGLHHEVSIAPEIAFERGLRGWRPDVVVVSGISRGTWRSVRAVCRRRGIPSVLYLREAAAIGHLTAGLRPDLLLADSGTLVDDADRLGYRAERISSVVGIQPMEKPPSPDVLLLVNPRASHGLHVVGPLAAGRSDIPIVLQESSSLGSRERVDVDRLLRAHANVTFRAFDPRAGMALRDTKVLLAPHQVDHRPRMIVEAQVNGIPVIASDLPGLVEAVGAGGLLVPADAGHDQWLRAVARVWDDPREHMKLTDRARVQAGRSAASSGRVAARVGELIDRLVVDGLDG